MTAQDIEVAVTEVEALLARREIAGAPAAVCPVSARALHVLVLAARDGVALRMRVSALLARLELEVTAQ